MLLVNALPRPRVPWPIPAINCADLSWLADHGETTVSPARNKGVGSNRLRNRWLRRPGSVSEPSGEGEYRVMTGTGGRGGADDALIRAMYGEHGGAVLAYATKLTGDRATADIVLQEALLRVGRHPEALAKGKDMVRAWLLMVAGRIVTDRARSREAAASPDQPIEMDVIEDLQKLSEKEREALIQLSIRGCTLQEASDALGVPPGTVKSRSCSALLELAKLFTARPKGAPA